MKQINLKHYLLTLLLAGASIPTFAEIVTIDGVDYWYDELFPFNGATVFDGKGCSGEITIPESIYVDGVTYTVRDIYFEAFSGCTKLTSVIIPNSIESISHYAFSGCTNLTSVTIPNSVERIYDNAFSDCSSLTSVTIGKSVQYIGHQAFYNCTNLKEIHISKIATWCEIHFIRCDDCITSNPLYYAHNLYLNGELITDLVIPEGVDYIKAYAFNGCSCLKSVIILSSVKIIEEHAFDDCSDLRSVTIPGNITDIGIGAFNGCPSLISVYCRKRTPLDLYLDTFSNYDATLYVPLGCKAKYAAAHEWDRFKTIEETNFSSVDNIAIDATEDSAEYFNLNGIKVATVANGEQPAGLAPGIYIVRRGSKTEKVTIR